MSAIYSMTGYGESAVAVGATQQLRLDLRSVNSRFLDLQFRLPDELRGVEGQLRARLQQLLQRGKVECRISLDGDADATLPGADAVDAVLRAQQALLARAPGLQPLGVADVWRLAQARQPATPPATLADAALQALDAAALQLQAARASEGARLGDFLRQRCDELETAARRAATLVPDAVQQQQQRFQSRWQEALALLGGDADSAVARDRLLQETAAFALRIDVAEECSRLQSHIDATRTQLDAGAPSGKRLDFLIQELHREANTLGSKSSLLALSELAVDMKVCIEQMREQVQNLE